MLLGIYRDGTYIYIYIYISAAVSLLAVPQCAYLPVRDELQCSHVWFACAVLCWLSDLECGCMLLILLHD